MEYKQLKKTNMKAELVKIKEFKVLKNVEEYVNGNHILLLGDNGVGKSSFIQFIEIALGKNTNIPVNATGEGEVLINKDGKKYTFHVKFKDGKPVLTVTGEDGMKNSRKGTIASIVGALDFDIDEFVELSKSTAGKKKQVEIFKSFLDEEIRNDLAKYEENIKVNYNDRAELNKAIKLKEGSIKEHRLHSTVGVKKYKHTEIKDAIDNLQRLKSHNSLVESKKTEFDNNTTKLNELQVKIDEMIASHKKGVTIQSELEKWLKENTPHKISEIEEAEKSLSTIEQDNKDFTDSNVLLKDMALLETMKEESGELTAKIESSKEAIANTIRDMDSPVKGLEFDEETLIYNGVPVSPDTLSTSEIMELGIRLKMAENPELGILFIQRGESLGTDRLKTIKEIADKEGWQIIMEQVERGTKKLHVEIMGDEI